MFRSVMLSLAFLVITVQPLLATCVDQAIPELHRGTRLTILRTDGSITEASFIRAERQPLRLVLEERVVRSQRAPGRFEIAEGSIRRLTAPPKPNSRPHRVLTGMFIGIAVGGLLGVLLDDSSDGEPLLLANRRVLGSPPARPTFQTASFPISDPALIGMAFGGGLGFMIGAAASSSSGQPRSWSCEEVSPAANPAPSDTSQVPIR